VAAFVLVVVLVLECFDTPPHHVHKLSQIRIRQPTPITPNALGNLEDEDDDEDEYDAFSTLDALPDVCETH
jgi:hypothetical protein